MARITTLLIFVHFFTYSQQVKVAKISAINMTTSDSTSYPIITLQEGEKEWDYKVQIPEFVVGDEGPLMEIIYTFHEEQNVTPFVFYEQDVIDSYIGKDVYLIYAYNGFENQIILYSVHKHEKDLSKIKTGESSVGSWTMEDIQSGASVVFEFRQDLLDLYGENAYLIIDCYLIGAINSYDNFAEANTDIEGCTLLLSECIENYSYVQEYSDDYYEESNSVEYQYTFSEVFLTDYREGKSKKGSWNYSDKQQAIEIMESVAESLEESFGEFTDDFILCYLLKAEENYKSFEEANLDSLGMEQLAMKCSDDIFSPAKD